MTTSATKDSHIGTSHSYFLRPAPNPSHPPIALLLRGVDLASTSNFPNIRNPPSINAGPSRCRGSRDEATKLRAGAPSQLSEEEGGDVE